MSGDEFNLTLLDELKDDLGLESFAVLIGKCADDVRVRLDKLTRLAAPAQDLATTRALAHQLKGLFLQFGATAATRDAADLETCTAEAVDASLARVFHSATRALAFFAETQTGESA
jgi:hypothetical protein